MKLKFLTAIILLVGLTARAAVYQNAYVTNNTTAADNHVIQLVLNQLPGYVVTNLPPSNGTNDHALLQSVCSSPVPLYVNLFPGTPYYSSDTIYVTNGITINGQGTTIFWAKGVTNCLFDCGASNTLQSFVNLHIDGGELSNYNTVGSVTVPYNQDEVPGTGASSCRNRNGIRINTGGGGLINRCVFSGFSGIGLLMYNFNGTETYLYTNDLVSDCLGFNNFISFYQGAGLYDGNPPYGSFLGTAGNHNPASFSYNAAEYQTLQNCRAVNCAIGILSYAANSMVYGCNVENCFYGVASGGFGPNQTHTSVSGCTFNHNTYPIVLRSGAMEYVNCTMIANTKPAMISDGGLADFRDCWLNNTTPSVIVTNDASNPTAISAASFSGCFTHANGPASFVSVVSSNCAAYLFGNIDSTGLSDGSPMSGMCTITNSTSTGNGVISYSIFTGNGSGLTNLSISGINASGTPSSTTYLSGSGVWSTPAGGTGQPNAALTNSATAQIIQSQWLMTNANNFIVASNLLVLTNTAVPGSIYHSPDGSNVVASRSLLYSNNLFYATNPVAGLNFQGSNYFGRIFGDASSETNQHFIRTMTVSGGTVTYTGLADGNTNAAFTITGGAGSNVLGGAIGGSNGAAASWMLGMDGSGNMTTNPVPSGGGGGGSAYSVQKLTIVMFGASLSAGFNYQPLTSCALSSFLSTLQSDAPMGGTLIISNSTLRVSSTLPITNSISMLVASNTVVLPTLVITALGDGVHGELITNNPGANFTCAIQPGVFTNLFCFAMSNSLSLNPQNFKYTYTCDFYTSH